jgi:hypothetical protein
MADEAPVPSNAPQAAPAAIWPSAAGLVMSLAGMAVFPCTCGHLNVWSFMMTGPAVILGWLGFLRRLSPSWPLRMLSMAGVVMASLVFMKNVADVLWFGHEPLLK